MRRALLVALSLGLALFCLSGARPEGASQGAKGTRSVSRGTSEDVKLAQAVGALSQGRVEESRSLFESITGGRLSKGKEDDHAFLRAMLLEEGDAHVAALEDYLRLFQRGRFRRQITLALARYRYVQGEYAEAENLLSVFSPGVEKDFIGRQGLVQRGLAQLARGDAAGALQFLRSAEGDLADSPQEEAYYYAISQAALRASKPAEATEALRRLLERHAKGDYAPQALYSMALSLETVGRAADAAGIFRQVMARYPNSYEATRARDRGIRLGPGSPAPLALGGGFAVQVGAFSRRDLAEALARDLKLAGVEEVSVKQGNEAPPVYRVRAGAYATRDEARALGERLRRERGFSYTVVPR